MSEPTNGRGAAPSGAPRGGSRATVAQLGTSYPAVGPAVSKARAHVTRWLRAGGADEDMITDVALAVTEACANAVVHAYRDGPVIGDGNGDGPQFRVVLERANGVVRVTVSDDGSGMRPRPDSPGLGVGVTLMAALCDRVVMGTQPDGSGTVVAMTFTAAGSQRMH